MTTTVGPSKTLCPHCAAPASPDGVVFAHSPDDPLQVAECAICGHLLDVGGHDW